MYNTIRFHSSPSGYQRLFKMAPPTFEEIAINFFVAETIYFNNIFPMGVVPHANFQCFSNFMTWSPSAIPLNSC